MGLFVDIPKPKAWPPPSLDDSEGVQKLIAYGHGRDPIGDKVHTAFACLFLFCLPVATAPASISMAILFAYSLFRLPTTWRTLTPLYNSTIYRLLLAWTCWSLLSLLWSPEPRVGLDVAETFRMVFLPLLLWPIMRQWKHLLLAFIGGVFIQNMFQLSELVGSLFLNGNNWIWNQPLNFLKGSEPHTGKSAMFMAYAAIVWIGVLLSATRFRKLAIAGLFLAIAIAGMSRTGSRAVYVGFITTILFFCYYILVNNIVPKKRVLYISAAALVITLTALLLVRETVIVAVKETAIVKKIDSAIHGVQEYFDGNLDLENGAQARMHYWFHTLEKYKEDSGIVSWVVGKGMGSISAVDFSLEGAEVYDEAVHHGNANPTRVHVHNTYIQLLYEEGLVGILLFLAFLVSVIREAREFKFNQEWYLRPLCIGAVLLWATVTFFENSQSSGRPFAMLILVCICIMYIGTMNSKVIQE